MRLRYVLGQNGKYRFFSPLAWLCDGQGARALAELAKRCDNSLRSSVLLSVPLTGKARPLVPEVPALALSPTGVFIRKLAPSGRHRSFGCVNFA